VRAQPGETHAARERPRRGLELIQPRAQCAQQLAIESSADLAHEDEVVPIDKYRTSGAPSPTRFPFGSVKSPTTS
jgi:hypothetical protein